MSVHKTLGSDLDYEQKLYVAANHVGFSQSANSKAEGGVISKFANETTLVLYALYQHATIGPCKEPQPEGSDPSELIRWMSWNGLAKMAPEDAMKLFVKIVEEEHPEDPGWYLRALDLPFLDADKKVDVTIPSHNNIDTESSSESGFDEIAKQVGSLEMVRRKLADTEAKLETRQREVVSFIAANVALCCTLMVGVLALGGGIYNGKGLKLYVLFFPSLIAICFLMGAALASRRSSSRKWIKLMIRKEREVLNTEVLKIEYLLKLLAGNGNHLGYYLDIKHRVRNLLRSLEDVHAEKDNLYHGVAIGVFVITAFVCSAWVICIDMLPHHGSSWGLRQQKSF